MTNAAPPDRRGTGKDERRMDWHLFPPEEVLQQLDTSATEGLTQAEAAHRLEVYGPNEFQAKSGPSALVRLLLQFHQPLIYILIVAGAVAALLGEYVDASVIFGVVILNSVLGFIQESRALSALEALTKTLATEATVLREGDFHRIASTQLVPGDVVMLQSGDKVPADVRLIRVRDLQVEEAALTGESVPSEKYTTVLDEDAPLADRNNMAYSSTLVTYGQGTGVVVATGQRTEIGHISELMESAEEIDTPLTRRIAWFSRILLVAILALAGVTFLIGLLHGDAAADAFLAAVALAVAAIPEGLPAVITITLAIGVHRMARRRAIVRKLPAVETLGSTTVICSDKTGTLTENQMTVQQLWAGQVAYNVSGTGYRPDGEVAPLDTAPEQNVALDRALLGGLLCNDSQVVEEPDGRWVVQGDPTEGALLVSAHKGGWLHEAEEEHLPRIDAVPFESAHQYMATLHDVPGEEGRVIFLKGSDHSVLPCCTQALDADGSEIAYDSDLVMNTMRAMAEQGLRVLVIAEKRVPAGKDTVDHPDVAELTFLGLQGMIDPPRVEAIKSVTASQVAGISVKMITGDHALTAGAIAEQLGISGPPGEHGPARVITGSELADISDEDLAREVLEVDVFARIPPEGKLRLVNALQAHGEVVAMTGDGVNDGPALRQADIGVAMGQAGTEVAREASDMVLTDDNFASIEAAVEEGRGVFDNLTKFLVYILPTNLGQSLVILVAVLLGVTLPMLPVHVLWVNMTTAVFLGLMLSFEPKELGIMQRPPRDPRAPLLSAAMGLRMLIVSAFLVGGAFGLFYWTESGGASQEEARTVAVNLFIMVQIFYLLNCRSMTQSMFTLGIFTNPWVVYGIGVMLLSQIAFTYAPPFHTLFDTAPVDFQTWLLITGVGLLAFIVIELEKYVRNVIGRPVGSAGQGRSSQSAAFRGTA